MTTWRAFADVYRCPGDRSELEERPEGLRCRACETVYPTASGWPDFRATRLPDHERWAHLQAKDESSEQHADARMQARNDLALTEFYSRIEPMTGDVLDVGGSYGLVRRFLDDR